MQSARELGLSVWGLRAPVPWFPCGPSPSRGWAVRLAGGEGGTGAAAQKLSAGTLWGAHTEAQIPLS